MNQINPQAIIDELTRRLQQLTLENVVLSARLADALKSESLAESTEDQ